MSSLVKRLCKEVGQISNLVEVGKAGELESGAMKEVLIKGHEILLAKIGDEYYVANNRCPHMRGKLSRGKLEGTVVTCPMHGSQFDLKSGEVVRWLKGSGLLSKIGKALKSPQSLKTYNVMVTDDSILVEI